MPPKRIQRTRQKGYRMPEGAVYVGRPTKWGNPFLLGPVAASFPSLTEEEVARFVVNDFRFLVDHGRASVPVTDRLSGPGVTVTYPSVAEIRAELRGKDLACWCPLSSPCHADVLIELAAGESA